MPLRSRSRLGAGPVLALAVAGLIALGGCAGPVGGRSGGVGVGVVTVDLAGRTIGVLPARYLGLSYESSSTDDARAFPGDGNLARLLENLGPGVIRFGGNSVDATFAGPTQAALAALAKLVRTTGWDVIFSVGLGHFTTSGAGRDAVLAEQALGSHLLAIACGNEPDDFAGNGLRSAGFTETDYLQQARTCIDAVRNAVPGVRIAGPDTSHLTWLGPYAAAARGTIGLLTQHYYPLSDCGPGDGTAVALLSRATAAAEAATISAAAAAARTDGVPLRVSETNSASCGGIPGVSDTFASALWALDYLLIGAEHGASGMNFHGSMTSHCNAYSPLCRTPASRYSVRPIYYGLLFAHLLGTGRLLPVGVNPAADLAAHAIRTPGGKIRVVVENLAAGPAAITVHAGSVSGPATIVRLTAPSPSATSQIHIQGAAIGPSGALLSAGPPGRASCRSGTCELRLAPYSAAIVTLP